MQIRYHYLNHLDPSTKQLHQWIREHVATGTWLVAFFGNTWTSNWMWVLPEDCLLHLSLHWFLLFCCCLSRFVLLLLLSLFWSQTIPKCIWRSRDLWMSVTKDGPHHPTVGVFSQTKATWRRHPPQRNTRQNWRKRSYQGHRRVWDVLLSWWLTDLRTLVYHWSRKHFYFAGPEFFG